MIADDLLRALDRHKKALQIMPTQGVAAEALANFYQAIISLLSSDSLQSGFPVDDIAVAALPSPLCKLAKQARIAFGLDNQESHIPSSEIDLLDSLLAKSPPNLPEVQLLARATKEWRYRRMALLSPPLLRIFLQPSLELSQSEEDQPTSESRQITAKLNILIINEGEAPAQDARILLDGGTSGTFISCSISTSARISHIDLPSPERRISAEIGHLPASSMTFAFAEVTCHLPSNIDVALSYSHFSRGSSHEASSSLHIGFPLGRKPPNPPNPYLPDLPLYAGVPWPGKIPGEHEQTISQVMSKLLKSTHFLYVLHGVRRTGKTSILYGLRDAIKAERGFCPVYVDLYSWHLELEDEDIALDQEGLFYEIAIAALRELTPNSEEAAEIVHAFAYSPRMSIDLFIKALEEGQRRSGLTPILLLDEFDWWTTSKTFDARSFLAQLVSLGEQRRLRAVLSYDWSTPKWYKDTSLLPVPVEFLTEQQLSHLIQVAPVPFTSYATSFLWLLTGGWEGLAHLILYNICEEPIPLVTKGSVASTISKLLISANWQRFFSYLLRSLTPEEIQILSELTSQRKVDYLTGEIKGVSLHPGERFTFDGRSDNPMHVVFSGLLTKQIIEPLFSASTRLRLRVGLLCYDSVLALYDV